LACMAGLSGRLLKDGLSVWGDVMGADYPQCGRLVLGFRWCFAGLAGARALEMGTGAPI